MLYTPPARQVIELKGNIRVLARIRPLLGKELANEAAATGSQGSAAPPVDARNEETIVLNAPAGSKEFEFDRVFQQQEGQEQVGTCIDCFHRLVCKLQRALSCFCWVVNELDIVHSCQGEYRSLYSPCSCVHVGSKGKGLHCKGTMHVASL